MGKFRKSDLKDVLLLRGSDFTAFWVAETPCPAAGRIRHALVLLGRSSQRCTSSWRPRNFFTQLRPLCWKNYTSAGRSSTRKRRELRYFPRQGERLEGSSRGHAIALSLCSAGSASGPAN